MTTHNPKVFISYSHDSGEHRARVMSLAERLRNDGIDCQIDRYFEDEPPAQGWDRWMLDEIDRADFVIVVCTETYQRRFRGHEPKGTGKGVKWEGMVITQTLYDAESHNLKFLPLIFSHEDETYIPIVLRSTTHYNPTTESGYDSLYRRLSKQPRITIGI